MMTDFRANPPKDLGGSKIVLQKDFQLLEAKKADGTVEKLDMPDKSNVLQWFCDDGTKVSASFKGGADYERCTKAAEQKIEAIKKSLNL